MIYFAQTQSHSPLAFSCHCISSISLHTSSASPQQAEGIPFTYKGIFYPGDPTFQRAVQPEHALAINFLVVLMQPHQERRRHKVLRHRGAWREGWRKAGAFTRRHRGPDCC